MCWRFSFLLLHLIYMVKNFLLTTSSSSVPKITEDRPENFFVQLSDNYDVKKPPKQNGAPAVVEVQIHPWKIGDISFEEMTFEVDLYFTVQWQDYRLTFVGNEDVPSVQRITLNESETRSIWKPVLCFRNVMGSHGLTVDPNFVPLRIKGRSTMFFVLRKVERFHCKFNLALYPMDTQECFVEIQALNYKSDVMLQDSTVVYELRGGSDPPQFNIVQLSSGHCTRQDGSSKYYSCVEYKFIMKRQINHHLMLTYAPSFLIVLLTWISFWLDVEATPARVGLGLTSLLTLATQFTNAQKNLPPVAYTKAIDVWMFTCIFMVFASIVEFAIANFNARKNKKTTILPLTMGRTTTQTCFAMPAVKTTCVESTNTTDFIARILFPLVFSIFNLCYWGYYGTQ